MPSNLPRITLYIKEENRAQLRLIAAAMDRSVNELINDVLEDFIKKYADSIKVDKKKLPDLNK